MRVKLLKVLQISVLNLVVTLIPVEVQGIVIAFWYFYVKVANIGDVLHWFVL